jgi:hypothetical protein
MVQNPREVYTRSKEINALKAFAAAIAAGEEAPQENGRGNYDQSELKHDRSPSRDTYIISMTLTV